MAALLPLPQIIFFLAMLFLPQGVISFSTTIDGTEIAWSRQADGWRAESHGSDGGMWSVKGSVVSASGQTTDVSEFVSVSEGAEGKKTASVKGKPVTVSLAENTITLSQEEGGALAKPVVITYVREGAPK